MQAGLVGALGPTAQRDGRESCRFGLTGPPLISATADPAAPARLAPRISLSHPTLDLIIYHLSTAATSHQGQGPLNEFLMKLA
jgi:hypothetical protein